MDEETMQEILVTTLRNRNKIKDNEAGTIVRHLSKKIAANVKKQISRNNKIHPLDIIAWHVKKEEFLNKK